jgi:hypothetical protein
MRLFDMSELDLTMFFGTDFRGTPQLPSEVLEPLFVRLIGAWIQGWQRGDRHPSNPEKPWITLDQVIERVRALGSLASEAGAVHANISCSNLTPQP